MIETLAIRPLRRDDLPQALAIQAASYPAFLREDEHAFASRIDLPASYCSAALLGGTLVGYLLAHGWPRCSPPPVGTVLTPRPAEILFIHDLAVGAGGRGLNVGAQLVKGALAGAALAGLAEAELVAVEGAATYWRSQGFDAAECSPWLHALVAGYGDRACWMTRPIAAAPSRVASSSATAMR